MRIGFLGGWACDIEVALQAKLPSIPAMKVGRMNRPIEAFTFNRLLTPNLLIRRYQGLSKVLAVAIALSVLEALLACCFQLFFTNRLSGQKNPLRIYRRRGNQFKSLQITYKVKVNYLGYIALLSAHPNSVTCKSY